VQAGIRYTTGSFAVRWLVTGTPLSRSLVERFVAGDTLDDGVAAAQALNDAGLAVSLDYLGEEVTTHDAAVAATRAAIESVERIATEDLVANISVKPSQLGLRIDFDLALENVERLLLAARRPGPAGKAGSEGIVGRQSASGAYRDEEAEEGEAPGRGEIFVRLDMESSAYTEATIQLVEELWAAGHRNVGTVVQAALRRSIEDIQRLNALGSRVRLVKGAYLEPPEIAYPRKADVDLTCVRGMRLLLREGVYPAIATHDEAVIAATRDYAYEIGLDRDRFEFQMLYGVRRDLQRELREEGYNVRIYVPYGDSWYPYLMRRIAERPANVVFVAGSIVRESGVSRLAMPLAWGVGLGVGAVLLRARQGSGGGEADSGPGEALQNFRAFGHDTDRI
jgi:proline dehydrogenase